MDIFSCVALAAVADSDPSTGTVVAAGISIVFAVLILLYLLISLEGVIFSSIDKKKVGVRSAPKAPAAPAVKPAPKAVAPVIEAGIPAEVVAAISAAIACMDGGNYTIRSLKRVKQGRSAWGNAGVASYTEPF